MHTMRPAKTQRGVALVTAVLIVAIVASIAAFAAFSQQVWLRRLQNTADRSATDVLVRGALHWASVALIDDASSGNTVDSLNEKWAMPLPTLPVEGGAIRVSMEDAQGRFNLNNVWRNSAPSTPDIAILQRLLTELRLDPSLTEPLLDWIDPDSNARPLGAEDTEYLNGKLPYRAANQPLASVDELRLIRGYDAKTVDALRPYVIALPVPTDINVNTAPAPVLAALVPGLDIATATQIASGRVANPMRDVGAFRARLPGGIAAPQSGIAVKSDYFLVKLETSIGRQERWTEALLQRDAGGKSTTLLWERPQPLVNPNEEQQPDKQP